MKRELYTASEVSAHDRRRGLQAAGCRKRPEAGCIAKAAAGYTPVDEAIAAIGDRPIILSIGQELPDGREYEFIRDDLDRYAANKRLQFGYTGMHWRRKHRPLIRDIHRRLHEYWLARYA